MSLSLFFLACELVTTNTLCCSLFSPTSDAVLRLLDPEEVVVDEHAVMVFSLLQLVCDGISLYLFSLHFGRESMMDAFFIKDLKDHNMNLISAYLHVLVDTVRSIITLTAAIVSKVGQFTPLQITAMDAYISIALRLRCLSK